MFFSTKTSVRIARTSCSPEAWWSCTAPCLAGQGESANPACHDGCGWVVGWGPLTQTHMNKMNKHKLKFSEIAHPSMISNETPINLSQFISMEFLRFSIISRFFEALPSLFAWSRLALLCFWAYASCHVTCVQQTMNRGPLQAHSLFFLKVGNLRWYSSPQPRFQAVGLAETRCETIVYLNLYTLKRRFNEKLNLKT